MDVNDPIFSHQVEAVRELAGKFHRVDVITGNVGFYPQIKNVRVFNTKWVSGKNFQNIGRFYLTFFKTFLSYPIGSTVGIFSHMTEVQSSLIAPFTRLIKLKHYLWYAHASKSKYLTWCHFWTNGILTSTTGSCPLKGPKIEVIGQAIDSRFFSVPNVSNAREKLVHFGRFDPSKNIRLIVDVVIMLQLNFPKISFTQIGSASNPRYAKFQEELISDYAEDPSLTFLDSMPRNQIPETLRNFDVFIHAFKGSLDKTLLESTASGIPVVTLNEEYASLFGTWSHSPVASDLVSEYQALANLTNESLRREILRRQEIVQLSHSLQHWSSRIYDVIISTTS